MNVSQGSSHWSHFLICFLTLLSWFILFIAGCNIESQPPRCEIIAVQKYTKSDIEQIVKYINNSEIENASETASGDTDASNKSSQVQTKMAKYKSFSNYCGDTISLLEEDYKKERKWRIVVILIEIIFGWGITSVGMIACISAAIGASSSYIFFTNESPQVGWWSNYLLGMIRGFVVYCLYLGGLLIFDEKAFKFLENFSVLEYIQLSASISLISFFVGANPKVLDNLLPDYLRLGRAEKEVSD